MCYDFKMLTSFRFLSTIFVNFGKVCRVASRNINTGLNKRSTMKNWITSGAVLAGVSPAHQQGEL